MTNYQLHLLLEAIAKVHSFEELSGGIPVISLLVRHLGFETEAAEAIVQGALHIKTIRARKSAEHSELSYVQ
jgi:hypothetical protein